MNTIIFYIFMIVIFILGCKEKLTQDQKAVKNVLCAYTSALKRGDFVTAYKYVANVSKEYISFAEFATNWTKSLSEFRIEKFSVENITIIEIHSKKYAIAIVTRKQTIYPSKNQEEVRLDYYLYKEGDSWRILRIAEIEDKINYLLNKGEKTKAKELAEICIKINPLIAATADEYIYSLMQQKSLYYPLVTQPTIKEKEEIKIKNPVIEIKILKIYDYGSAAYIDFQITNKSDKFISYWKIEADIFNANGEYLGHSFANGENLRPGQSVVDHFICENTRAFEIASWRLYIGRITIDLSGGKEFDAIKYFILKEIK